MHRVMVIGWDCSDFRLIDPWIKDGYLPNLQRLIDKSKYGTLNSINPPVTPIAWSTIVTGRNPGKHGVSGFMSFRANSYHTRPANAADRHGKDVWELLSSFGKKVAVIGVPLTFPTRPVNGCLISGLLTPNESVDYCYPKGLKQEILSKINGYVTTPADFSRNFSDFSSERFDEDSVKSVFDSLEKHIAGATYLAEEKEWDFFMAVFNETDWVQHRFWSCIDRNHPRYDEKRASKYENVIRDVHIRLDQALGQLSRSAPDANIMLISDHGVGPLYYNVNTNHFLYKMKKLVFKKSPQSSLRLILARLGFSASMVVTVLTKLKLTTALNASIELQQDSHEIINQLKRKKASSTSLAKKLSKVLILTNDDVDWSKSVAFARMGHGEIFLNREKIFPKGIVNDFEYLEIRSQLIEELKLLNHDGRHIVENVFSKDELNNGRYVDLCPDIQLQPSEGYIFMGGFTFGLRKQFIVPEASYAGHHSMNGIFVLKEIGYESSPRIIEGAQLLDIVPTILHLMQVPFPPDLDGKSLADNIEKPAMGNLMQENASNSKTEFKYSKQEEEDIEDRLRSLGYI